MKPQISDYTRLVSTNGHISIMRTEDPNLPPFAVIQERPQKELLDTCSDRSEAGEMCNHATKRITSGDNWPHPDDQACTEIHLAAMLITAGPLQETTPAA